jgi:sulfhydrogenase subunit gamma (sulfur reductase)
MSNVIFEDEPKRIENPFQPRLATIIDIKDEAPNVRTFRIAFNDKKEYNFLPGQFAIWSIPGVGEAPFSYSSSPHIKDYLDFTILKTGRLTSLLFQKQIGDKIGLRGSYGNGFPIKKFKGKDLLFIMGGIGAAPLKGVLDYVLYHRKYFNKITVLHGARTPELMLFKEYFHELIESNLIECFLTVDSLKEGQKKNWTHNVGVVTTLIEKIPEKHWSDNKTMVMICGPPIMYKFVIKSLEKYHIPQNHIFMTLERRMRCGLGFCGHCAIDYVYTCIEGPVFTLWDARYMKELI